MLVWLQNTPDNYNAQLAIMGWFLTLTSKMTGYTIPGVGVAPGGTIEQPRDAIAHYLMDMETLADAMAVKKNWDRPQYAILKEMYLDLKRMHYSFRVNRSWCFLKNLCIRHDLFYVQGPDFWQVPSHVGGGRVQGGGWVPACRPPGLAVVGKETETHL